MKRTGRTITAIFAISAAGAFTVAAQQSDTAASSGMMQGSMQGMMQCPVSGTGMGMMGMMGEGPFSPGMLLRMAEPLDLTPEQIQRLEALREDSGSTSHMNQAMAAHQRAADALSGDSPSLTNYEEALREAADHMIAAHTALAATAIEARTVLTAEQRSRLDSGMQLMRHMMGGAGMQGMMGGSGMHGMNGMMGGSRMNGMMMGMMGVSGMSGMSNPASMHAMSGNGCRPGPSSG